MIAGVLGLIVVTIGPRFLDHANSFVLWICATAAVVDCSLWSIRVGPAGSRCRLDGVRHNYMELIRFDRPENDYVAAMNQRDSARMLWFGES